MSFTTEIRRLASIEILDAYEWYESQKPGLGDEFLEELETFLNILKENPHIHSFYHETVRQGALNRFPYTVVYEIFNTTIVVYSVFMEKRNPMTKRTK